MRFFTTLVGLIFSTSVAFAGEADCKNLASKTPKNLAGFKQARVVHKEKPRWGHTSTVYFKRNNLGTLHVTYFDTNRDVIPPNNRVGFGMRWVWMSGVHYGFVEPKSVTNKRAVVMEELRTLPHPAIDTNGPPEYMSYGIKNNCIIEIRLISKKFDTDLDPNFKKIQSELAKQLNR